MVENANKREPHHLVSSPSTAATTMAPTRSSSYHKRSCKTCDHRHRKRNWDHQISKVKDDIDKAKHTIDKVVKKSAHAQATNTSSFKDLL
jgi:DNA-directed RNA polymerase subunit M/transcription elongation factor TFIIS